MTDDGPDLAAAERAARCRGDGRGLPERQPCAWGWVAT